MPYVYVLSDHEEDGAKHMQATLDASKLSDMIAIGWGAGKDSRDRPRWWKPEQSEEQVKEAQAALARLFREEPVERLVTGDFRGGHYLNEGWGGIQLHVIELK